MVTKVAAVVILGLSLLLSSLSFAIAGDEFPPDEAWAGEIVGQAAADIYAVAEASKAKENSEVREMRKLLRPNWPVELSEAGESSHPKGEQPGVGVLKTELKPDSTDVSPVESNREAKRDKERQASQLEGFSIACKEGACEKKDPIAFTIVPFGSPRAIRGSLD